MDEGMIKMTEEESSDFLSFISSLTNRGKKIQNMARLKHIGFVSSYLTFFGCLTYIIRKGSITLDVLIVLGFSALVIGFLIEELYLSKKRSIMAFRKGNRKIKSVLEIWNNQQSNGTSIHERDHRMFDLLAVHALKAAHTDITHMMDCSSCELLFSAMSPDFKASHALNITIRYIEQAEAYGLSELLEKLTEAVSGLNTGLIDPESAEALTSELINLKCPIEKLLKNLDIALIQIGQLFESREIYYPQVLQAALAVKNALNVVDEEYPTLSRQGQNGSILLGVVKGDIHDIGKNIVKMFLEFNGYAVIDLGVDISPEEFVEAISHYSPDIVGVSAFINTVIPSFKDTVLAIRKAGFNKPVLAGGIAVNSLTIKKLKQELDSEVPEAVGDIIYAHNVQEVLKSVNEILCRK
ncbi:MAG: B12-binding domain-containing protein [Candidatus Hodarchaeota archaeon]